jgi:hypothetical protein
MPPGDDSGQTNSCCKPCCGNPRQATTSKNVLEPAEGSAEHVWESVRGQSIPGHGGTISVERPHPLGRLRFSCRSPTGDARACETLRANPFVVHVPLEAGVVVGVGYLNHFRRPPARQLSSSATSTSS